MTANLDCLRREAQSLGPWFHNLHLTNGLETNPGHPFGDFPAFKWQSIAPHLPEDLNGKRALDIGCNAGFYSLKLAERGAAVTAIDSDPFYLRQARWAADVQRADIQFHQKSVYELMDLGGPFDIILFMGVFYHLRHPLLALDLLRCLEPELLIFQTLTYGSSGGDTSPRPDLDFAVRDAMLEPTWPHLAFIENTFAGDPTNWWAANEAAVEALLRAAGFAVAARPAHEIYFCETDTKQSRSAVVQGENAAAARAARRNCL